MSLKGKILRVRQPNYRMYTIDNTNLNIRNLNSRVLVLFLFGSVCPFKPTTPPFSACLLYTALNTTSQRPPPPFYCSRLPLPSISLPLSSPLFSSTRLNNVDYFYLAYFALATYQETTYSDYCSGWRFRSASATRCTHQSSQWRRSLQSRRAYR